MPVRKRAAPGRRNFCGWLGPATALLVLLASCAEPAKQNKTSPSPQASRSAQPTKSAPAAKPAEPAPAATAGQPAKSTEQPAPAAAKTEPAPANASTPPAAARKPSPQSIKPSGNKSDESRTVAATGHAKATEPPPAAAPPMTEADRTTLADQIRKQAETLKESQAAKPPAASPPSAGTSTDTSAANKPSAPQRPPLSKDATSAAGQTPQPAAPNAQNAGQKGCGPNLSGIDLTPLPVDEPQPKFKANALKFEADTWVGKEAKFVVEVTNEGEGKLAVRLKGG